MTIDDNQAPVPTNSSLPTITSICTPVTSLTAPTAIDNCSGSIVGTTTTNFPIASNTNVIWTFTDGFGNSSTQIQVVQVGDAIAPLPTNSSLPTITSTCNPVTSITAPTASDNCSGLITGTTTTNFPITSNTTVTWTFTDAAGNTSTQNQSVVVGDNNAPVADVSSLSPVVSTCPVPSISAPTATDDCSGQITGTTTAVFPISANTTITWTFTDATGNTSTQTQVVTIDDNQAPIPTNPSLPTITSICTPVTSLTAPTAIDNCSGLITGTTTVTFPVTTTTTITWTYVDGFGNQSTQSQIITIDDLTAPVPDVTALPDVTGACSITTLNPPTATDNCSGSVIATTNATLPITSNTTVTWIFNDGNGNTTSQNQNVVLNDNVAPIPDNLVLADFTSSCSLTTLTAPSATDNCDGLLLGTTNTIFPITSNTTITWTFSDAAGNTTTQNQNVIITDSGAPIPDATLNEINEICEVSSLTAPTATDGCQGTITGVSNVSFPITTSTLVTWTFTNNFNNVATQTQQVNIGALQADIALNGATLEVVNPILNATYQWVDCDNNNAPIDGATGSAFAPIVSGNYAVTMSYLSCSTTSLCSSVEVNGLENSTWKFSVYPTPTNDMIHVTVPEKGSLKLYDLSGKLIWVKNISEGHNPIDFKEMATGTYMIEFTSTNYISSTRIVVQH